MESRLRVSELMRRLDRLSSEERSYLMSQVKNSDTGPELMLRRVLWARGERFLTPSGYKRRYKQHLVGRPDVIFPGARLAVFVDGCFWHGCPLKCKGEPGSNQDFWMKKIETNQQRDREVNRQLTELGWQVKRYWEHQIRRVDELHKIVTELIETVSRLRSERIYTVSKFKEV